MAKQDDLEEFLRKSKKEVIDITSHMREKHRPCGACGRPLDVGLTEYYYKELFHKDCVDKMKRGEPPQ